LSLRADIITRRTYNRPLDPEGLSFETWSDTVDRVIDHHKWLWERAGGIPDTTELCALAELQKERKASVAGRTLWLGGTEISKKREASQFNCAFLEVKTVHDVVDAFWLLLQGCGVGFKPVTGTLNGFMSYVPQIEIIHSTRCEKGGAEFNTEEFIDGTWTITVGDSAEAWAKSVGKILAGKYPAKKLVFDFSQIRPAGGRLAGYGWLCSGDEPLSRAYEAIAALMNARAGQLLTKIDILDIMNWLGTVLSTRRAAEIGLCDWSTSEWQEFAEAKDRYWEDNPQRAQSNNSIIFNQKPTLEDLFHVFEIITRCGGSEPGLINGQAARKRAPWFAGVNPCGEVLLTDKSFCNLAEVNVAPFKGDYTGLEAAVKIMARASYRQTLVNLDDGILQAAWHQNNEFLRLCGVGLTGIVRRPDLTGYDLKQLRNAAITGAYSMADELGTQRPKNVTTIKPSGTVSKIMDTTEGCHMPPGRYVINNVGFSKHDPLVPMLKSAGYGVFTNPFDKGGVLVSFPVEWKDVPFEEMSERPVNAESAVDQLERYKFLMDYWCDQNVSITVSYDENEIRDIVFWLFHNWDSYVGVSFIPRVDPTKTAKEIGYAYLPQEVVSKELFEEYTSKLQPVSLNQATGQFEIESEECATGACPMR
jgi:ribonucleoside-triphosphate reductase